MRDSVRSGTKSRGWWFGGRSCRRRQLCLCRRCRLAVLGLRRGFHLDLDLLSPVRRRTLIHLRISVCGLVGGGCVDLRPVIRARRRRRSRRTRRSVVERESRRCAGRTGRRRGIAVRLWCRTRRSRMERRDGEGVVRVAREDTGESRERVAELASRAEGTVGCERRTFQSRHSVLRGRCHRNRAVRDDR